MTPLSLFRAAYTYAIAAGHDDAEREALAAWATRAWVLRATWGEC